MRRLHSLLGLAGCLLFAFLPEASARKGDGHRGDCGGSGSTNAPVEYFRELLSLNPAAREKALVSKSDRQRNFLLSRLREYDALAPADREFRLRATQLRFHLLPLMKLPPAERTARLAAVPEDYRVLITERLAAWDQLPAEVRQEVLENENLMQAVLRHESQSPAQQQAALAALPADVRSRLEKDLARWRALSEDRRQRMLGHFNGFFSLNEREKSRIVSSLPQGNRAQLERTLREFERLPAEQRNACIKALKKLSDLTPQQQMQFFQSAVKWQEMSETERETWRQLINQFPPLPPDLSPPPLPPDLCDPGLLFPVRVR